MSRKKSEHEAILDAAAGGEEGITVADGPLDGMAPVRAARGRKPVDPNAPVESKAAKFRRLANRRVPKALKALQYVENLGNRGQYQLTEQQADRIIEVIGVACQRVFARLKGNEADISGFSL